MMFSSGKHDKLTTAWSVFMVAKNGVTRQQYVWVTTWDDAMVAAEKANPRFQAHTAGPSVDAAHARPLHNPANPILAEFREAVAAGDPYADPESWLANLDAMEAGSDAWRWRDFPEELEHAERVLTFLAYIAAPDLCEECGNDLSQSDPRYGCRYCPPEKDAR